MRKLAGALLASLLTLAAASPASGQNLHEPKRIPGVGELFVLRAAGGELERVRAGVFELVLRRPASAVTVFSDRPRRVAREQRLRRLVDGWEELGFAADPPNAALSIAGAPSARDVLVFELSRPRLGAGGRTLRFRARPLSGKPERRLSRFAGRADRVRALRFGAASLFVDPSDQAITPSFQFTGIPAGGQVNLSFTNALVDANVPMSIQASAPAGVLIAVDIIFATPNSASPLNATIGVGMSVKAGATRLAGTADIPPGATVSVTIGGAAVPISDGDFSVPLQ
jgi:hypothetical protein